MNGKWLAERIFNGPFCKHETKEMALMRVTPEYVCGLPANDAQLRESSNGKFDPQSTKNGSNGYLSLKHFLEKYSLPRIVKIVPEEPILTTESTDPASLLNGTLLLYKQYRSGKIEAKKFPDSRTKTSSSEALKDFTSTIVIPDTYQGRSHFFLSFFLSFERERLATSSLLESFQTTAAAAVHWIA